VWHPGDKRAARQRATIPPEQFFAAFIGVNDSNPSRKGIPELLAAWSMFSPAHPNARLYLHTSEVGNLPASGATGGVRIDLLAQTFHIAPVSIVWVDQYRYKTGIPASELVTIAQASDVLVLPSRGEGFGLPLLEFQRVGTPVITTDCAAGAERCFSGWKISGEPEWSWQNSVVIKPGIADLGDALEIACTQRDDPARRDKAIRCAAEYDIDTVLARYWIPALESMAAHLLESVKLA
jgi:glycosyltransferase involved in cell wall biosynthesis